MKEQRDKSEIQNLCAGCKFGEVEDGKRVICHRPGQTSEDVAAAIIDALFGDECMCYESIVPQATE